MMQNFDVIVIGAGIVGSFIFNDLVLNGAKVCLLEKNEDVGLGSTKANSGIIHSGYDAQENTLKAKFNVRGNMMYEKIAKRLGENIVKTGSLVVGDKDSLQKLKQLKLRGKHNGVGKLKILNETALKKLEPNLSQNIKYGLFAKSAKIISPYNFSISLVEEALLNGGELKLNFETKKITKTKEGFDVSNSNENLSCKFLVNCCAEGANEINKLLNEPLLDMHFAKGEYMILDESEFGLVNRPIFPLPNEKSKGVLVCPTANKNVFLGPTAIETTAYDTSFNYTSIDNIKNKTSQMVKNINFKKVIKLFAGVRVKIGEDFYIKFSNNLSNYLVVSGICSPGLTSAPAIAEYAVNELRKRGLIIKKIKAKKRKPYTNILKLSKNKLNKLIKNDSRYGNIICRCENITEGEIVEVLNGPIKNLTTDGIKRRLRTTMGRCQGSFCYPKILKLMADFYKKDMSQISMRGNSSLIVGDVKEGGLYETK